jgi:hypothetical protein
MPAFHVYDSIKNPVYILGAYFSQSVHVTSHLFFLTEFF